MCDPAGVMAAVGIGSATGQLGASWQKANADKANTQYQAKMQLRALYRQREADRLAALQQENGKAEEYEQSRSAALAAIGASGLGEHLSFFQSIDPNAKTAFLRDVSTIRLNMTASRATTADQVGVTEMKKRIGMFNSTMSKVGAVSDFIQTAMQAASMGAGAGTPAPAH